MLDNPRACVGTPILMSARALNYLYPGIRLNLPPVSNPFVDVNIANGTSMNMLGTLNVLFRFSGPNVKANSHKVPVMEYWHNAYAAVFAKPFILSISLLCIHQMWIDYADKPAHTVELPCKG